MPRYGKYQAKIREKCVATRRARGDSVNKIACDLGMGRGTVEGYLKHENVKEWIEKEHLRILEDLPTATDNMKDLVKGMKTAETPDERKLGFEATKEVLKVGGIIPTNSQSTFIQNIYGQNNLVLSPVLKEMLERHEKSLEWKEDVVEVEVGTTEG